MDGDGSGGGGGGGDARGCGDGRGDGVPAYATCANTVLGDARTWHPTAHGSCSMGRARAATRVVHTAATHRVHDPTYRVHVRVPTAAQAEAAEAWLRHQGIDDIKARSDANLEVRGRRTAANRTRRLRHPVADRRERGAWAGPCGQIFVPRSQLHRLRANKDLDMTVVERSQVRARPRGPP